MAGKRGRKPAEAEAPAAAQPKSFMEESADALAGVEGALTGSKRKAAPSSTTSSPKTKKSPKIMAKNEGARPRSNSIDRLADVAGSLLKDDLNGMAAAATSSAALVAAAAANAAAAPVPDPMAVALPVPTLPPMAAATKPSSSNGATSAAAAAPTGFRKKGPATKAAAAASAPAASAASKAAAASSAAAVAAAAAAAKSDGKSKKTQITYNPDIPMTKEQLTAWRREMRRVRNRESAAASRRKVRDRIEELEDEVAVWKRRYQEVLARLGKADNKKKGNKGGKSEEGGDEDVHRV